MVQRRERSEVPIATNAPQQSCGSVVLSIKVKRSPRGGLSEIRLGVLIVWSANKA
jgi:hypothetical protein